jgi:Fe-S-cluster containining protein
VEATRAEQRRIRALLGVSWRWFRRRYLTRYADGSEGLRVEHGRCVFLGPGRRCRIYAARPAQCRFYPFWPGLADNAAAWRAEARRCEGIGRGTPVSPERLRRLLRQQRK